MTVDDVKPKEPTVEAAAAATPEEEMNEVKVYMKEMEERFKIKHELRTANQGAAQTRPGDSHFSKLDSSLKKNTAYVKKIRNFSAAQIDAYLKDMASLNLSKYISEVAAAIVDSKLKMTDVQAAVKLCSVLHQTYAEFSMHLFENWQKVLGFKSHEKVLNPSKLRVDLRFYAELLQSGLFTNKNAFSLLGSVLTALINMDKEEHVNVPIVLSFCKHCGDDYAGLLPRRIRQLATKYEIPAPKSSFLPAEKQQNVKTLLKDYYQSLCKHLLKDHQDLQNYEKHNMKILQTKGELSQERKDRHETMQNFYEKLLTNAQNFSEILDEDMPILKTQSFPKTEDVSPNWMGCEGLTKF